MICAPVPRRLHSQNGSPHFVTGEMLVAKKHHRYPKTATSEQVLFLAFRPGTLSNNDTLRPPTHLVRHLQVWGCEVA